MAIKKILCVCGAGLCISVIMKLNVKNALKLPKAEKAGKAIGLNNIVSRSEMTQKLKEVFGK